MSGGAKVTYSHRSSADVFRLPQFNAPKTANIARKQTSRPDARRLESDTGRGATAWERYDRHRRAAVEAAAGCAVPASRCAGGAASAPHHRRHEAPPWQAERTSDTRRVTERKRIASCFLLATGVVSAATRQPRPVPDTKST